MKKIILLSLTLLVIISISGCSNKKQEITVSAAASLKDCLAEIQTNYQKENPKVTVNFNFGASGTLQQQIEQGAPSDLFISAGKNQMEALDKKGLLLENTKFDLLKNSIVIIAPLDSKITDFSELSTNKVQKIALGEPGSVPAGKYAAQVLDFFKLTDILKDKIVYAKDVAEVRTWVETGNADAGFVYKTDALISNKVKIITEAAEDSHDPVVYPMAIIKATKNKDSAQSFYDYLATDKAKEIFIKYGFDMKN